MRPVTRFCLLVPFACMLLLCSEATAQSDAEIALNNARKAYDAQQFEEARDLSVTASQTDKNNPDVFLLMGRAHYQLGELNQALAAWRRVVALAPGHQFATRMIASLEGRLSDVEVRVRLIRQLIDKNLLKSAAAEMQDLRKTMALTGPQTLSVLRLEAEIGLYQGDGNAALRALREIVIRDPGSEQQVWLRLLEARAQVAAGGDAVNNGLAALKEIANAADTPEGRTAALVLLSHRLSRGEDVVEEIATWIAANGNHRDVHHARSQLLVHIDSFIAATRAMPRPTADSKLTRHDEAALKAATHVASAFANSTDASTLVRKLAQHFENHYASQKAWAAADAGLARLSALSLPAEAAELVRSTAGRVAAMRAGDEYARIVARISERAADTARLSEWIEANGGHPKELEARGALLTFLLAKVRRQAPPNSDAELSETDLAALKVAEELLPRLKSSADATKLVTELASHWQTYYDARGAFDASDAGLKAVLAWNLTAGTRLVALQQRLQNRTQAARSMLAQAATSGRIVAGPLPEPFADVVAIAGTLNTEYPEQPAWNHLATVAGEVAAAAAGVPWPTRVTQAKAPHAWAVELALPVVGAPDGAAAQKAFKIVDQVVTECVAVNQDPARAAGFTIHERLLAVVPRSSTLWPTVVNRHVDLLSADATIEFHRNLASGQHARNTALTDKQARMIELLTELVAARPAAAGSVLQKLNAHLAPWKAARHDELIELAYNTLNENLPPAQQRTVRLALAQAWFAQVTVAHSRLTANGFQVPRNLDPLAEKALKACYDLEGSLGGADPLLAAVRQLREQIVTHYMGLNYSDVAAAAIAVRGEPRIAVLDEGAELRLAALKGQLAQRELVRQLNLHNGQRNIALTPAFAEAIAASKKFITDHPTSPRLGEAVDQISSVAAFFQQHKAWTVASGVYFDLETFAKGIPSLSTASAGSVSAAEAAALAGAQVLHTRASTALAEWRSAQKGDKPAPTETSREFQDALDAWKRVIAEYRQSSAARTAIRRIMDIAMQYAALDGWDVAESMYASLLEQDLPLSAPERFEFARAVCQLGKVMPDHARQVLSVLAKGQQPKSGRAGGRADLETVAAAEVADADFSDSFGMKSEEALAKTLEEDESEMLLPGGDVAGGLGAGGGGMAPGARGGVKLDSIANQPAFAADPAAAETRFRAEADAQLLAALKTQQASQAQKVAMLRDNAIRYLQSDGKDAAKNKKKSAQAAQQATTVVAVLSEAELQRQQTVVDAVYKMLQAIRQKYPTTSTADQARGEIIVMVNHWRGLTQWERAAKLARQYLEDNPRDPQLPTMRQEIARDYLAWASQGVDGKLSKQEMLDQVSTRFNSARQELMAIIEAFPDETAIRHQAQWDVANSYLTQARVVSASSPTLARGQFVRAANELLRVAEQYHDHPQIGSVPNMLWSISDELTRRSYHEEAITVWNELTINYPTNPLADQAAMRIAQTWHQHLRQPLRAVESYLELNFARGGNDAALQETIYQIAISLKNNKRWVESLHVLQTYVDSFPMHANAGQGLTQIGQIHQTNEAWEDAIEAYGRVIRDYDNGAWSVEAKWAIAECTINLSRWQEAIGAYAAFQQSYPKDARVAEAVRRVEVLKTLARYQQVVDEPGQRKAFDAQYQIGEIVRLQLANPVKSIIELRKVAQRWPQSHLADDALFEIGRIYLNLGETQLARDALLQAAQRYPESPLADDALVLVGSSYVSEADKLAAVDRGKSITIANEVAQREAYRLSQGNRRRQTERNQQQIFEARRSGTMEERDNKEAYLAAQALQFDFANAAVVSNWATQHAQALTAEQLADRQDRINAALRKAVDTFDRAAKVTSADKADDALLQMAKIYDERLKDSEAAMAAWKEIVRQYSGTTVAENASWKIAEYHETHKEHQQAISAYQAFLKNYRRSPRAGLAQAAIAENHENLGEWVLAMDAYTNYLNNFPKGPLVKKARDQINWIKTYRL